ncbi:hypothetical protein [Nostoc sp. NOS(2021)]|uniref:hypothetical protein n=1 Tax=Nostoc sp. NOS(2021) TaxID=2815407 RepID=UPI0025D4710B|nr:hypothetical protein [Nostoc sp. NOS(2021)]
MQVVSASLKAAVYAGIKLLISGGLAGLAGAKSSALLVNYALAFLWVTVILPLLLLLLVG